MANKRQRKKQQKRQIEKQLEQSQLFTKREIKELSRIDRDRIESIIKKREKEKKIKERNERAKRVYRSLISEGVDAKTARKMRYMSQEKIDAFLKQRRQEYIKKHQQKKSRRKKEKGRTLLIFWRDKNDYTTDPEGFDYMAHAYKYVSAEFLVLSIRAILPENGGEIGDYQVVVTDDPEGYKRFYVGVERGFYSEWIVAYEGKGDMRRYRELLVKVYTILNHLYYASQKMSFILTLIRELHKINPKTAKRLQEDLRIEYV